MSKATDMYVDTYNFTTSTRVFTNFFSIASFITAFLIGVMRTRMLKNIPAKSSILPFVDQEAVGMLVVQKVVLRACLDMHVN